MAFVRLAHFPGATEAHYAPLRERLGTLPAPPGRLLFAAGPVPGGWQVVQVWRSREDLDEYNRTVFLPAVADLAGRAFPSAPTVVDLEPVDLVLAPG